MKALCLLSLFVIASISRGLDTDGSETRLRRSEVRGNPLAGFDVVHAGNADNLDFRLTDFHVALLDGEELMLLRGTVYARYGHVFEDPALRDHFEDFRWYEPCSIDAASMLDETDLWNLELIAHYEERLGLSGDGLPAANSLAGFWHRSPSVGSGYSERFFLFPDGEFIHRCNSMDGSARLLELFGKWSIDGGHMELLAERMVLLEGGEFVEAYASYASEHVIENGLRITVELDPGLVFRLPLDGYFENYAEDSGDGDLDHLAVPSVRIGHGRYWRLEADPAKEYLE